MDNKFTNAIDLFNAISRDQRDFPHFVFRGQGCSKYDLEPGITRNLDYVAQFHRYNNWLSPGFNYRNFEYEILRNFIKGCDKTGIPIPSDGDGLRRVFKLVDNSDSVPFCVGFNDDDLEGINAPLEWPDFNSYSIMIMAQHHGVPTRLLDWTGSILTAMYFASVDGMKRLIKLKDEDVEGEEISIWGLNAKFLNDNRSLYGFALIKPPTSLSVNISPQEGCFTTRLGSGDNRVDYILNKHPESNRCLRQYPLNIKESISMYSICKKNGYTGAMLFPGLDGAAKEANESLLLRSLKKRFNV
ncbi:FRG domain-containing protein [Halomonas sp. ISL-60]|nr:FRG domain-containing protein [Halomonas sp. ISL-60]